MSRAGDTWARARTWLRRSGAWQPTTWKVLVFAAICLVVLAVLAARIGNITFFSHRVAYAADMADATGLQPSDDVKIAGVTVGQVTGVSVQRAHALVTFAVNNDVRLPSDTQVGTQWHNVLGQQFLYLYPGHSTTALKPGATLPLSHNVPGADVGALLNSLGPLLSALRPSEANQVVTAFAQALQGDQSEVDQLIDNAASVSQTVGSVDTQVGQVIDNLNQVFGALAQRSGDLGTVVSNLDTLAQSRAGRNDLLDQTVTNLGAVAGDVAKLEADTHGSLSSAISDLEAVSGVIEQHANSLSQGLSTLGSGLAPYADISAYGQWFQVQLVYTCLADEHLGCTYYEPSNAPAGAGPLGMPPSSGPSVPGLPSGSSAAGTAVPGGANVGDVLHMVAGQGSFLGSAS